MPEQNSIISYTPQPYYRAGASTITGETAVASIENTPGIFSPDLSNFTTVVPSASATAFAIQVDYGKTSAHLASFDMTIGLIGCSLLTYEDSGGEPDLATVFSENIDCTMSCDIGTVSGDLSSLAHNSQDSIDTFDATPMPSVISGGRSNLVFHGLGYSSSGTTGTVYFTFNRAAADVAARPHARLIIGHLFIGVDLPVTIDPRSFSWTVEVMNQRFKARDAGAINSDGTLVKRSTGEFIKIPTASLLGMTVTGVDPVVTANGTSFFDLVKTGTSYPMLFNPFPVGPVTESGLTVEQANLTARQNYFSIYGFFNDPLEMLTGAFRDGLNSEYRARYRIEETR